MFHGLRFSTLMVTISRMPARLGTWQFAACLLVLTALGGCHGRPEPHTSLQYVATIPPLGAILREVVGDRGNVDVLLPAGASPHTYEPTPSDARRAARGFLIAVSPDLDGWASHMTARDHLTVMDLLPKTYRRTFPEVKGHGKTPQIDPHFWTDPLVVQALLPVLVGELGRLDPDGHAAYQRNAERFAADLQRLHGEVEETLRPVRGRRVAMFHPSFHYLFARYGIITAAVLEPAPGKEPTAQFVTEVVATLRTTGAKAIFTEPQLPRRPAQVVAEATHLPLGELDPLGGGAGRETYASLIRHNAEVLRRTVQ